MGEKRQVKATVGGDLVAETESKKPVKSAPDTSAKPAAKAAKGKKEGPKDTIWSRRDFFSLAGWAGFMATTGLSSIYFLRLLFPRVLFEPTPLFKAGKPEDYTVGEVSTKWVKDQRVWIIREPEG
ncbi:MAG: hypothetical protein VYC17_01605, partial [Nitrospinota bacterium]|nr:hypothetical protein [Nitrospinota bacterium]